MDEERIILVDEQDRPCGNGEKLDVHRQGLRHRAFSIFIWNHSGETLLQQRAAGKYHSAGLWANSCCGHPRIDEPVTDAARRRLTEELGMVAPLAYLGHYSYRAELSNDLIENEFVHLFAGQAEGPPVPNPDEVQRTRWIRPHTLLTDIADDPVAFTPWFRLYVTDIPELVLTPPATRGVRDPHARPRST